MRCITHYPTHNARKKRVTFLLIKAAAADIYLFRRKEEFDLACRELVFKQDKWETGGKLKERDQTYRLTEHAFQDV